MDNPASAYCGVGCLATYVETKERKAKMSDKIKFRKVGMSLFPELPGDTGCNRDRGGVMGKCDHDTLNNLDPGWECCDCGKTFDTVQEADDDANK